MFSFHRFTVACANLLFVAPFAVAAQYSFVNIVDERGPIGFGFTPQAVSDTGAVAFVGNQGGTDRTYVGNGGAVQPVVLNLPYPPGFSKTGDWALNESGVAAGLFGCCNPRHDKIQLYNASGASTIAEVMGGATFDAGFGEPVINNSGAVAFVTYMAEGAARQGGLVRWVNGTSTTLVDFAEGFRSVGSVAINELGDVAFTGHKEAEGLSFYRTDGTTLTRIAGPFPSGGTLAINDSGAVAIIKESDAGGEGIFVGDGGPLATVAIADPTTPFYGFERQIDINNQGTVAFTALLWDGTYGIYAGSDPVNDKVVQIGDYLFGQQVRGLGRPHLNNRGDIAFWFEVRDPRDPSGYWSGIALAVRESPLSGDYNGDGSVDAADYVVWRDGLGSTYTSAHYDEWKGNFGAVSPEIGAGAGSFPSGNVPEPASLVLLILPATGCFTLWRASSASRFVARVSSAGRRPETASPTTVR